MDMDAFYLKTKQLERDVDQLRKDTLELLHSCTQYEAMDIERRLDILVGEFGFGRMALEQWRSIHQGRDAVKRTDRRASA